MEGFCSDLCLIKSQICTIFVACMDFFPVPCHKNRDLWCAFVSVSSGLLTTRNLFQIRLFFHLFKNIRTKLWVYPGPKALSVNNSSDQHVHPIFTPVSLNSRTSLWETDYNIHKSNSTYFSDLDIARTVLVTPIYTPGVEITRRELEQEVDSNGKMKYPGPFAIMLGSVYCTFKKEIRPYERYEMQSKVAGWDRKWMYVLTFFLRPEKRKGEGKTLLAVGISKYVMKKGRLTVSPARILQASGLLPPNPNGDTQSTSSSATETPASGEAISTGEILDEPVVRKVVSFTQGADLDQAILESQKRANMSSGEGVWTWDRIEQERLRGLEVVRSFIDLDEKLAGEVKLQ